MEKELRTRLFDRLGRTVQMTPAGETLHHYAESILRQAADAKLAIADIGAGEAGRIAVGASSTLATYVLPVLLRQFRATLPRVEIAVHTGISAQVLEMVRANQADVGLVTAAVDDRLLTTIELADYETCVVVPRDHPYANRDAVSASDLADIPLILMETGTNLRTYVDRLLSAAGVQERVAMEMDNVEAIKRMIEAGLGISMLPEVSVRNEVAAGRLAALRLRDVPQSNRRIALVHRRDKYLTAALKAFITLLRREVKS